MSIKLGDKFVNNIFLGDKVIQKLYLGKNLILSEDTTPPSIPDNGECISITLEPNPLIINELMKEYTIIAKTVPKNTTEPIVWSTDMEGTSVYLLDNGDGTATATAYRDVTGTITVRCGSQSHTAQVIVNTNNILTTSLNFNESKLVFNNNGDKYAQEIKAEVFPRVSTEEIIWSVIEGDDSMVRIEPTTNGARVIPLKVGVCKIQGQSGIYKDVCEIINIQHADTSLFENPTIRIENHKAVLEQNGHIERFDVSYEPNTGHPQYLQSKEIVGDDGITYYLSLLKTGTSKFRIDGMIPDSGGWKNILNGDDSIYPFALNPFPRINNFNFSYTIANKNNTVNHDLFDFSIRCINTAFPALNITEDASSVNTMLQADYNDSWFGVQEYYSNHFEVKLNNSRMIRAFGEYEQYPYRWRSTSVHELGHSLGIKDQPSHTPSLYSYGANPDKRWYMQPNDLDVIKYYYKNYWGVDITLTQEQINEQVKAKPILVGEVNSDYHEICFNYGYYTDEELINNSDVILTGNLNFDRREKINIGNDVVLEYDIYSIDVDVIEKGVLRNHEIKIPTSANKQIEDSKYKMYLEQYDNCPCSLINLEQGLKECE